MLLPLVVNEFKDWWPWLAVRVVRWSARRLGDPQACARYEEEWVANLEEVPGKLSPLVAAFGYLAVVPRMRRTLREGPVPLNVCPDQMPENPSGFVGRLDELARLDEHLFQHAVKKPSKREIPALLVTGGVGTGKTALALRWAHLNLHRFPDGNLYADLGAQDITEPASAFTTLGRFLSSLGIRPAHIPGTLEERVAIYRALVARRRLLAVLDDVRSADQVRPLLLESSRSFVIAISRRQLTDFTELGDTHRLQVTPFDRDDAVELLRRIVGTVRVNEELDAARELARLCSYLPLALRIAGERGAVRRGTTLPQLNAELTAPLDLPERLGSVLDWVYRSLPTAAARLFRLLGTLPDEQLTVDDAVLLMACAEVEARRLLNVLAKAGLLEPIGRDALHIHPLLRAYAQNVLNEEEPDHRLRRPPK
ncbi:NB-ARC domain-containing protein [Actinosynnema pretiosum]|uniref:NB-ARC domain-containing protein n=1 Tax=Actinosynnema pretiosum TaxID=42197 RepID=UPI0012FDFB54|nr:NB-ARC domain-containing protein [Actinosynnema pretiosum]